MEIKHRAELGKLILSIFGTYGDAVEVGCAEGLFSMDLLRMGFEKLYMVDNWGQIPGQFGDGGYENTWHEKNFKEAMDRIDHYKENITVLRGFSHLMAKYIPNNSLRLVYVDCDHGYDSVMKDIIAYMPKLVAGGVMAFHDFWEELPYGVNKAVYEYAATHGFKVHHIPENKPEDSGAWFSKY